MTHDQLVQFAARWLRGTRKLKLVIPEAQGWSSSEFPDAIGWDVRGDSILVECKTSLSDFKNDRHKPFRANPELGMGLFRYYLAPRGLLTPEQMPERWGLLEIRSGRVCVVKKALRFPGNAHRVPEQALLVRLVRAARGNWPGIEKLYAEPVAAAVGGASEATA